MLGKVVVGFLTLFLQTLVVMVTASARVSGSSTDAVTEENTELRSYSVIAMPSSEILIVTYAWTLGSAPCFVPAHSTTHLHSQGHTSSSLDVRQPLFRPAVSLAWRNSSLL